MQSILRGLPLPLPVIEFNGAFVSDLATGRHHICNAIEPAIVKEIVAVTHLRRMLPFVSSFNGLADRLYYVDSVNPGMRWYVTDRTTAGDRRLRKVVDLEPHLSEQVVCLTLIERQTALLPMADTIRRCFGDQVELHCIENIYSPGWFWLTVHDRRATKAHALRYLAEEHGLDLAAVTAFGDALNDIPMFKVAGRGIAVGNADVQLKQQATEIIGTNQDDSVVKYLQKEWAGQ